MLATHLIVRYLPKLPQKSAQEGNYHGNDKSGKGKDGEAVEGTCQREEKGLGARGPELWAGVCQLRCQLN